MHSLLARQLRLAGLTADALPTDLNQWQTFLSKVDKSYTNADRDRALYEDSFALIQLQGVLNGLQDSVCAFDVNGNLLFINQSALGYLGESYQNADQERILTLFRNAEDNEAMLDFAQRISECHQKRQVFHDNQIVLHLNQDQEIPVICNFTPFNQNDEPIGQILFFSDISEIKQAEEELIEARDNAQRASQAKSQFLSSMSHELRTPMNAILGYSELLKDDLSDFANNEIDSAEHASGMLQYVENILSAGWHLLELINKVLDLTRIEAGKMEVVIDRTELVELLKECISLITPLAEKRGITVNNKSLSVDPHYALTDRGRLKQVIINLLSNAVKYNCERGSITISLERTSRTFITLSISDTGIGLTPEQKEKIFEPFSRFSGVNLIEGTGIGLTITKKLLEMMDAKIDVESTPGKGSRFWLELPTGELERKDTDPNLADYNYILLYIEDSRTNISLVSQILKSARPDIALVSAQTGELGLELALLHKPNIILLDINLPGIDGFEVLSKLRAMADMQDIPVIALSAMDTTKNLQRSKELGIFRYIVKPLDIKNFLTTLDDALKQDAVSA